MLTTLRTQPHVAVIGGGITGLAAAWALRQRVGAEAALTVLEAASRWGGKVETHVMPGPEGGRFLADAGPESFITRKREAWDLAHALGLQDRLIDPGSEARNIYVLDAGRPLKVPLNPVDFVTSPLLTLGGKLRLLAEPFIPARRDDGDESLAEFASRRLGREAMEKFIGPILAGIYNTDPATQSVLTTSPVMREMEKENGSLVAGALARMQAKRRARARGEQAPPAFATFREGAQELVDALVARLGADLRCDLRLNAGARRLRRIDDQYEIELAEGEPLLADAVIVATPANAAAGLLRDAAPESAAGLARIRHTDIGTLSLAYRGADARLPFRLNGLMIPRREKRRIDALTWTSAKMPDRAPRGYELARVFFGAGAPAMLTLDDAALLSAVRDELRALIGLDAAPIDYRVSRWPASFPQADVGHLDRVDEIERRLPPGLFLAGSSYRGLGVPDCIRQGQAAAQLTAAVVAAPA